MAGETIITIVGNLTADPEIRHTASGVAVASFTIASTPRNWDRQAGQFKDGETLFMRCSAWRDVADNVANSLTKGTRVVAQGRLMQNNFETRQGEKRTTIELQIDEIGPSLRYATAQVTRNPRSGGYGGGGFGGGAPQGGATQAGGFQAPQQGGGFQAPQQGGGFQAGSFDAPAGGQQNDAWAQPDPTRGSSFDNEPPF